MTDTSANGAILEKELDWLSKLIDARFNLYFEQQSGVNDIYEIKPPDICTGETEYAKLARQMDFAERVVFILALTPHVRPQLLDNFFIHNKLFDRVYTEFGGRKGKTHGGFLPTCETASFILAGNDLGKRLQLIHLFDDEQLFTKQGILCIEHQSNGEPFFSGALMIAPEYLQRLTTGRFQKPDYSFNFPAKLVTTPLTWDDLVLGADVLEEIETINAWFLHSRTIMEEWGLARAIKPGYRSLFYGPPGTGKTLTATLLGATAGVDVYRIDLSMVVSKYIGETEKNLANVFDQAENKNWILFFDEADALFGKRTQTSNANDRYANQEISYLLQRVEDFPGMVILATNLKVNIDEAFARRFQAVVYFPMPDSEQRLKLWQGILNTELLDNDVDLHALAEQYELSGGAITNVVRHAAIRALQQNRQVMECDDLTKGITRELRKEGKTI